VHILQELSDQEEQPHAGPGPGSAPKQHIYHADAIHEKLEDIAWAEEAPWEESLVVTNAEPTVVTNCDDDLERELAFYNQVGQPCSGVERENSSRVWVGLVRAKHTGHCVAARARGNSSKLAAGWCCQGVGLTPHPPPRALKAAASQQPPHTQPPHIPHVTPCPDSTHCSPLPCF
jgi:hypothetical protein